MFFFACGARPAGAKPPPLFCFLNKKPITTFQLQKCTDNPNLRLREQIQLKSWIWTRTSELSAHFCSWKAAIALMHRIYLYSFFSISSPSLIWLRPFPRLWLALPPALGCLSTALVGASSRPWLPFHGFGWRFLPPLTAFPRLWLALPPALGCLFRGVGWRFLPPLAAVSMALAGGSSPSSAQFVRSGLRLSFLRYDRQCRTNHKNTLNKKLLHFQPKNP